MTETLDEIKVVVALRTARAALGWSQEEAATQLGVAKSTLARIETMEGGTTAAMLGSLLRAYLKAGVRLDFLYEDEVKVSVSTDALRLAKARLADVGLRRSDRRVRVITDDMPEARKNVYRNMDAQEEQELAKRTVDPQVAIGRKMAVNELSKAHKRMKQVGSQMESDEK